MSYTLKTTISELEAAISKLQEAVADYESATKDCDNASKTLLAGWEGDRQKDFAEQCGLNLKWFQEMADVTEVYITALNVAKAAYTALDIVR